MSFCGIPLTFGHLEDKEELTGQEKRTIRHADQAFQNMDRRVLYIMCIILTTNIFVLIAILHDEEKVVRVQAAVMAVLALFFTTIQVLSYKYNLLRPVVALWRRHESQEEEDRLMFGLAVTSFILGSIVVAVGAVAIVDEKYKLGIGLTIGACGIFIITPLFYRLHVGVFIRWAESHPPFHRSPPHHPDLQDVHAPNDGHQPASHTRTPASSLARTGLQLGTPGGPPSSAPPSSAPQTETDVSVRCKPIPDPAITPGESRYTVGIVGDNAYPTLFSSPDARAAAKRLRYALSRDVCDTLAAKPGIIDDNPFFRFFQQLNLPLHTRYRAQHRFSLPEAVRRMRNPRVRCLRATPETKDRYGPEAAFELCVVDELPCKSCSESGAVCDGTCAATVPEHPRSDHSVDSQPTVGGGLAVADGPQPVPLVVILGKTEGVWRLLPRDSVV
jgi:hypothetical protein